MHAKVCTFMCTHVLCLFSLRKKGLRAVSNRLLLFPLKNEGWGGGGGGVSMVDKVTRNGRLDRTLLVHTEEQVRGSSGVPNVSPLDRSMDADEAPRAKRSSHQFFIVSFQIQTNNWSTKLEIVISCTI